MDVSVFVGAFIAIASVVLTRIAYVMMRICTSNGKFEKKKSSLRTVLCIGSGGHTTELIRLFSAFDPKKYEPRMYIMADNDTSSNAKILDLEKAIGDDNYSISKIPRSRNVNQMFTSAIVSTLRSTLSATAIILEFKPDVILCNGPGTCIPVCITCFMLRCLFILDCRIVFIESICRVKTLSLTGRMLQFIADVFVVQWPQLKDVCYRAQYFGRLT